jgi:hypothetical protein
MSSKKESTEEAVQITLNTTGIPFSRLTYNQDKLRVRCKKLSLPTTTVLPSFSIRLNSEYADWYRIRIIYLDYHYSRYESRLPVHRSLYSHRTLFRVSFSHLEVAINCANKTRLEEVRSPNGRWKFIQVDPQLTFGHQIPTERPYSRKYDTKTPLNTFQVIYKSVKGGFPKD